MSTVAKYNYCDGNVPRVKEILQRRDVTDSKDLLAAQNQDGDGHVRQGLLARPKMGFVADLHTSWLAGKMIPCLRNEKESRAMKNGRRLLEESISLFDGKINPIRCFSAQEIKIATNNFDEKQVLGDWPYPLLYRGFLRGRAIIVKRPQWKWEYSIRDIVVASRLCLHKNVLKPIGCCLETEFPLVVYESFDCEGTLNGELLDDSVGHDPRPLLPWKHRLKIAVDISNLVAYLHTALPRPLVHRDIQPFNILLDKKNGVAKLFDFDLCMSVPKEKPFIESRLVTGTIGYIDPEYMREDWFNEKADVYGFGVTLLNLLSGRPAVIRGRSLVFRARDCVEDESLEGILDPRLSAEEPWPGKDGQFKAFLMLAFECTRDRGFDRPDMTEVGTRLASMYRAAFSSS